MYLKISTGAENIYLLPKIGNKRVPIKDLRIFVKAIEHEMRKKNPFVCINIHTGLSEKTSFTLGEFLAEVF